MKKSKRLQNHAVIIKFAAWSYLLLAVLYPVFSLSSMQADKSVNVAYFVESIVKGTGADHVWWLFFTLIPMLLVFGGIGFYSAVKPYAFKTAGISLTFSCLSALGFLIGIGRWSTMNWGFGEAFLRYKDSSDLLAKLFIISNEIMGFWIGHVFAELCLFIAIGAMSFSMFYSKRFPVWLSGLSGLLFIFGTVSVFRDLNGVAHVVHIALNAFMLVPLFFILLAIGLYRFKGKPTEKPIGRYAKRKKNPKKKRGFMKKSKRKKS